MAFKPGESGNPNGRPPGTPNKVTKQVREALLEALNSGDGAVAFFQGLKEGSKEDKRVFAQIVSRLIPTEISGPDGRPLLPLDIHNPDYLLEVSRSISFILSRSESTPDLGAGLLESVGNLAATNVDVGRGLNGQLHGTALPSGKLDDDFRIPDGEGQRLADTTGQD